MEKIKAILIQESISSSSKEAFDLFEKSKFGEKSQNKIVYSNEETFFLLEENKLEVLDSKYKNLSKEEIGKKLNKINKNFRQRYLVYKDLRKKGFIPKAALKFGCDFRIYENKKDLEKTHSKWLVKVFLENSKLNFQDFAGKVRIANSTKKSLLIAIIDSEEDITYFETNWKQI